MTRQPTWKLVAQLGDVNPIEYGGYFVYVDTTGVYAPEAELLIAPDEDCEQQWEIRRFTLDQCTFINGVLSDNRFHPDHAAWFAKDLASVASYIGEEQSTLINMFTGDDVIAKARAWQAVGDYHGFDNLDAYPLYLSRAEVVARYAKGETVAA